MPKHYEEDLDSVIIPNGLIKDRYVSLMSTLLIRNAQTVILHFCQSVSGLCGQIGKCSFVKRYSCVIAVAVECPR